jgi:hypothetical protein
MCKWTVSVPAYVTHGGGRPESGKPLPNKAGQLQREPPPHHRVGTSMVDVRAGRTVSSRHFQFFSVRHNNRFASMKGAGENGRELRCFRHQQHPHWSIPSYHRVTVMTLIPTLLAFCQGCPSLSFYILLSSRNYLRVTSPCLAVARVLN